MNTKLAKITPITNDREHKCPHCGKTQIAKCYDRIVSLSKYKDISDSFILGTIFTRKCSSCSKKYNYYYPITFVCPDKNFILYYPVSGKSHEEMTNRFYLRLLDIYYDMGLQLTPGPDGRFDSQGITCRIVRNFQEVRDKVYCFYEDLDDRVMALVKFNCERLYETNKGKSPQLSYFYESNGKDIRLVLLVDGKTASVNFSDMKPNYDKMKQLLSTQKMLTDNNTSFFIDTGWGAQILDPDGTVRKANAATIARTNVPRRSSSVPNGSAAKGTATASRSIGQTSAPYRPANQSSAPVHRPIFRPSDQEETAASRDGSYYGSYSQAGAPTVPGYMEVHTDPYRAMMEGGSDGYSVTHTPEGTYYGTDGYYPFGETSSYGSYDTHFTYEDGSVPFE